jgi:DNA-binding MarR family transcriptional regulator
MKRSRLDRPHIKLWIAHELADSRSQREIAQALDTSQPTISRIARRDDVQDLIQEEERKFLQQTKDVLEKIQNDPRFLAEYQRQVETELFKSLRRAFR